MLAFAFAAGVWDTIAVSTLAEPLSQDAARELHAYAKGSLGGFLNDRVVLVLPGRKK